MQFQFDERKAAQAAAHLLRRHQGSMKYLKLIKLLYLADRRCLIEVGRPITGDRFVSMDKGPVLSRVLELIKTPQHRPGAHWPRYVGPPQEYRVCATAQTAVGALSNAELLILDHVYDEFGAVKQWALVKRLHKLPEWQDPHGSAIPIDPRTILQDAGYSQAEIAEAAALADEHREFGARLSR